MPSYIHIIFGYAGVIMPKSYQWNCMLYIIPLLPFHSKLLYVISYLNLISDTYVFFSFLGAITQWLANGACFSSNSFSKINNKQGYSISLNVTIFNLYIWITAKIPPWVILTKFIMLFLKGKINSNICCLTLKVILVIHYSGVVLLLFALLFLSLN